MDAGGGEYKSVKEEVRKEVGYGDASASQIKNHCARPFKARERLEQTWPSIENSRQLN